jgi:tetratricopeptide (TPR) repeat protein
MNDVQGFVKWFKNIEQTKIENSNELAILYNVFGEFHEIQMDRKSAILMAEKTLKIKPDYADGYVQLGRLNYLENNLDDAKLYLNKAAQINKNDSRPSFYLGLISDRRGDNKAREHYFKLARKVNGQAVYEVGWRTEYESRPGYYLYTGYLDLIEQGYRDKIKLDDNVKTKNELAYFLALENRNLNEALQLIEENLKDVPDDMSILDTKSVILYQKGEYQKANENVLRYEERITKDVLEGDASFSYYLGRIKWAVGDTVSAKNYFNYTLKQTNPDANGRRHQQELKIFMAEHNF